MERLGNRGGDRDHVVAHPDRGERNRACAWDRVLRLSCTGSPNESVSITRDYEAYLSVLWNYHRRLAGTVATKFRMN